MINGTRIAGEEGGALSFGGGTRGIRRMGEGECWVRIKGNTIWCALDGLDGEKDTSAICVAFLECQSEIFGVFEVPSNAHHF